LNHEITETFAGVIGHPLRKIVASVHVFEGSIDSEFLAVWFIFEDVPAIRLLGASDGEALIADNEPFEPVDMAESGEVVIADISNKTVFGNSIGKSLHKISRVESNKRTVGVQFDFGESLKPLVLNWGDELYLGADLPAGSENEDLTQ
jgi:hypothetical protein